MFSLKTYFTLFLCSLLFFSCKKKLQFLLESPKKISVSQTLSISVKETHGRAFKTVSFALDGKEIANPTQIDISNERLGEHVLTAKVTYEEETKKLTNTIVFLANKSPVVYKYKIINTYPHDTTAYTQGLEYYKGFLYESTGLKGKSSLRKVDLTTGKVLQKVDLAPTYFAEGITILKDTVYQLTWQNRIGFLYDIKELKQIGTFSYGKSKEGWGLTNDGKRLIKTDGTKKIWFINPKTFKETSYVEAYTDKRGVKDLNELEYIKGKIYANKWQKNILLIMNPKNGAIEGIADLNGLEKEVRKTQKLKSQEDVLNGIAYDKERNRLFVTGKHWGKLFEIELIEKE